jgi:hypothetical protein
LNLLKSAVVATLQKLVVLRNLIAGRGLGIGAGELPYLFHRSYRGFETSTPNGCKVFPFDAGQS